MDTTLLLAIGTLAGIGGYTLGTYVTLAIQRRTPQPAGPTPANRDKPPAVSIPLSRLAHFAKGLDIGSAVVVHEARAYSDDDPHTEPTLITFPIVHPGGDIERIEVTPHHVRRFIAMRGEPHLDRHEFGADKTVYTRMFKVAKAYQWITPINRIHWQWSDDWRRLHHRVERLRDRHAIELSLTYRDSQEARPR